MSQIPTQRKQALAARRALDSRQRQRNSQRACRRIARLPIFRRARRIGLYWPLRSEADPRPLLAQLRPTQTAFLPRVVDETLRFIALNPERFRHQRSALGITEPLGGRAQRVEMLDLLIMPLAAFDDNARRIGMGGGFYDRTLAPGADRDFRRPYLLGLAFDGQRMARIEMRPWDIPLDAVATAARIYRRAGGAG